MQRITSILLLFLGFFGTAFAADWVPVYDGPNPDRRLTKMQISVDMATIAPVDNYFQVWVEWRYELDQKGLPTTGFKPWRSAKRFYHIACSTYSWSLKQVVYYDRLEKVVGSSNSYNTPFLAAVSESIGERIADTVCRSPAASPVEDAQAQPADDQDQPVDDQGQPVDSQEQLVDDQGQPVEEK